MRPRRQVHLVPHAVEGAYQFAVGHVCRGHHRIREVDDVRHPASVAHEGRRPGQERRLVDPGAVAPVGQHDQRSIDIDSLRVAIGISRHEHRVGRVKDVVNLQPVLLGRKVQVVPVHLDVARGVHGNAVALKKGHRRRVGIGGVQDPPSVVTQQKDKPGNGRHVIGRSHPGDGAGLHRVRRIPHVIDHQALVALGEVGPVTGNRHPGGRGGKARVVGVSQQHRVGGNRYVIDVETAGAPGHVQPVPRGLQVPYRLANGGRDHGIRGTVEIHHRQDRHATVTHKGIGPDHLDVLEIVGGSQVPHLGRLIGIGKIQNVQTVGPHQRIGVPVGSRDIDNRRPDIRIDRHPSGSFQEVVDLQRPGQPVGRDLGDLSSVTRECRGRDPSAEYRICIRAGQVGRQLRVGQDTGNIPRVHRPRVGRVGGRPRRRGMDCVRCRRQLLAGRKQSKRIHAAARADPHLQPAPGPAEHAASEIQHDLEQAIAHRDGLIGQRGPDLARPAFRTLQGEPHGVGPIGRRPFLLEKPLIRKRGALAPRGPGRKKHRQ